MIFVGVRYAAPEEELEALETRKHPLIVAARKAGLKHYWAAFGEKYYLFVGAQVGVFGVEDSLETHLSRLALSSLFDEPGDKLKRAEIGGTPELWVQWL